MTGNARLCDGTDALVPEPTRLVVCASVRSVLEVYWSSAPSATSANACISSLTCEDPELALYRGSAAPNLPCGCAVPITVMIRLKSPSFTYIPSYVSYFEGLTARALSIAPYQVRVSNATRLSGLYSQDITLLVFPASSRSFSAPEFEALFTQFASWNVSAGEEWSLSIAGPYDFLDFFQGIYACLPVARSRSQNKCTS